MDEGRQHDHQRRLSDRCKRLLRVVAIQFRLDTKQHIGLARLGKHFVSIERRRQGTGDITTDTVRRFANETEAGTGQAGQFIRQNVQLSGLGTLLGDVAEENRTLFTSNEAFGNPLALGTGFNGFKPCRNRLPFELRCRLDNRRQHQRQMCRGNGDPGVQIDQRIVAADRHQADLTLLLRQLAQALGKQRVILAQEAAKHQGGVEFLDFTELQAQPRRPGTLAVTGKITATRTEIDAARTQATRQLLQEIEFFQGGMRRCQRGNRFAAMRSGNVLETIGDVIQRDLPFDFEQFAANPHGGFLQAPVGIQAFVGEAILVGNPALVDFLVLTRHNTHHLVSPDLHGEIAAQAVVRTDAFVPRHFPASGRVTEGLGSQRTDRTQIDHVAREFGIHTASDKGLDFRMHIAVGHAEFHDSGNFLPEADAAGAMDATRHFLHRDQRSGFLVEDNVLGFLITRAATTIADCQILQHALAALIADRAIQRVIDQQELHHALLGLDRKFGVRLHLHSRRHRCRTGGQRFRCFFDLHQTHPATGRDGQFLVIADMRDIDAKPPGGIHDGASRRYLRCFAVDFDI